MMGTVLFAGVGYRIESAEDGTEVRVDEPTPAEERLDALAERLEKATSLAEVRAAAREAKRREPPARELPTPKPGR